MKQPLVSRAQLKKMAGRPHQPAILGTSSECEGRVERDSPSRQPLGLLPSALPAFYLAMRDGSLLVMQDKSKNPDGATGPQVCLATISAETLAVLVASKSPVELKP